MPRSTFLLRSFWPIQTAIKGDSAASIWQWKMTYTAIHWHASGLAVSSWWLCAWDLYTHWLSILDCSLTAKRVCSFAFEAGFLLLILCNGVSIFTDLYFWLRLFQKFLAVHWNDSTSIKKHRPISNSTFSPRQIKFRGPSAHQCGNKPSLRFRSDNLAKSYLKGNPACTESRTCGPYEQSEPRRLQSYFKHIVKGDLAWYSAQYVSKKHWLVITSSYQSKHVEKLISTRTGWS